MQVRWTPEAVSNLADIELYLRLADSPFLEVTARTIYEGCMSLPELPFRGRPGRIEGTRELLFSKLPYVVVYRIANDAIHLLSIRHAARKPLV